MSSQVVRFDGLRSLGEASIGATYTAVGTAIAHPMRQLKFVNNTDSDIIVSFDGTNNNDFVPTYGFSLYDFTTNKTLPDTTFVIQNGTQVYAKYATAAPTVGSFYVVAVYGQGD